VVLDLLTAAWRLVPLGATTAAGPEGWTDDMTVPREPDSPIRESLRVSRALRDARTSVDIVEQAVATASRGDDSETLTRLRSIDAGAAASGLAEPGERLLRGLAENERVSPNVSAWAWAAYARSRAAHGALEDTRAALVRATELGVDPEPLARLAQLTYQSGGRKAAEDLMHDGMAKWPEDPSLRVLAARVALDADDTLDASVQLQRVLSADSNHPAALALLSRLELVRGEPERAIEAARRVVPSLPSTGRALLVTAMHAVGRLHEDPGLIDAVLADPPMDAPQLVEVGKVLLELDRPQDACTLLDEALRLAPGDLDAYYHRGLARAALGDYAAAMDDLDRVAARRTDPDLTALRGVVAVTAGDLRNGLQLLESLYPADRPSWAAASHGSALAAIGDVDGARAVFNGILERDPDNVDVLCGLGQLELDGGAADGPKNAERILRRATELAPGSALAHALLAEALRRSERLPEAIAAFDRALAIHPTYPYALASKGQTLVMSGQRQAGIELLSQAIQATPASPWILDVLVEALQDEPYERADQVLRNIQRAVRDRGGDYRDVLLRRADLAKQKKCWAEAEKFYRMAREQTPEPDEDLTIQHVEALKHLRRAEEALAVLDTLPPNADPSRDRVWSRIDLLWTLDRLLELRSELERMVDEEPSAGLAWAALGEVCRLEGRRDDARRLLNRVDTEPDIEEYVRNYALASLGAVEFDDGDVDVARAHLREVIRREPEYVFPLSVLIALEAAEGQRDALAALAKQISADPANVELAQTRAAALYALGDVSGALDVYEACLTANGDDPSVLRAQGWAYVDLGRITAATQSFQVAAEIPDVPQALPENVEALVRVRRWREGQRLIIRAEETGSSYAGVAHAMLALAAGDFDTAQRLALEGCTSVPQSRFGPLYAARAHWLGGRAEDAIEVTRRGLARWPQLKWVQLTLGEALAYTGRFPEAADMLDRLVSSLRRQVAMDTDDRMLLGSSLLGLRRPEEAIEVLLPLLSTSDQTAEVLLKLVNASLQMANVDQAVVMAFRAEDEARRLAWPIGAGVAASAVHELSVLGPMLDDGTRPDVARLVKRFTSLRTQLAQDTTGGTREYSAL
jgi:tetratricopeptide (TPR) repeat protein